MLLQLETAYIVANKDLREKCPYSELFWSVFSRIIPGKILTRITPYTDIFYAVKGYYHSEHAYKLLGQVYWE